jgi:hypothetical protein
MSLHSRGKVGECQAAKVQLIYHKRPVSMPTRVSPAVKDRISTRSGAIEGNLKSGIWNLKHLILMVYIYMDFMHARVLLS